MFTKPRPQDLLWPLCAMGKYRNYEVLAHKWLITSGNSDDVCGKSESFYDIRVAAQAGELAQLRFAYLEVAFYDRHLKTAYGCSSSRDKVIDRRRSLNCSLLEAFAPFPPPRLRDHLPRSIFPPRSLFPDISARSSRDCLSVRFALTGHEKCRFLLRLPPHAADLLLTCTS